MCERLVKGVKMENVIAKVRERRIDGGVRMVVEG